MTTEEMPLTMPVPRWSSRGDRHRVYCGDVREVLRTLPDQSVHCCVTSPPYWGLRDYGVTGQIGQEKTPEEYVATMVEVFREVRRVLHDSGTVWLNVGDSYSGSGRGPSDSLTRDAACLNNRTEVAGLKPKDLCLIPWRLAIALQADGWWVRSVICWAKKSCMPESVTDRPTNSWEPIFLLAKSAKYFYDAEAVKELAAGEAGTVNGSQPRQFKTPEYQANRAGHSQEPVKLGAMGIPESGMKNQRNVWHLGPEPYAEAHFATFPTEIPRRAILAGTSARGCCPKCYAPWVRDTGNEWQPGCECDAGEPVKCTVLEPFLGSGTTSVVAHELGRNSVGIELSERYVDTLIVPRLQAATAQLTFDDML